MFDELRELYQEVILDHGRNPRNLRHPDNANCVALGNNPLCGDVLTVYLSVDEDDVIQDAAFLGKGCAISMASASMMTEILKGKTAREAERIFGSFHRMCTEDGFDPAAEDGANPEALERLEVLSGVREFPMRVKCATLAWHTMNAAMSGADEVTTE
jgi:nitrogen fixation NifU-like protein